MCVGGVNILKYVLPINIKLIMHNALLLSRMNYGICYGAIIMKEYSSFRKKACVIIVCKYTMHTQNLILYIFNLKVNDILKVQQLRFNLILYKTNYLYMIIVSFLVEITLSTIILQDYLTILTYQK